MAVGTKTLIDAKGFFENEVNVYPLGVLPVGEIDRITAPVRDP